MKTLLVPGIPVSRRDWLRALSVAATAAACRAPLGAAASPVVPTLTEAQREGLRGVLREAIARKAIPGGALAVLSRGQVVFREAVGRAEFDSERPFAIESPCFIASLSKPITATYMTLLDERGVVSLDDPVEKFLPEFKGIALKSGGAAKTTLRVWHLLSHRSGLPGNADMGDFRPGSPANGPDATLASTITGWVKAGLHAEPGARFAYGSAGYIVAGRIAEVVHGKRFERLLQEALLDPLGMARTTFHPDAATLSAVPARYQPSPKGPQRDVRVMPLAKADGLINPAGGLCSRLDDMAAFLALHLNRGMVGERRIVKTESLARMYRPHPPRATEAAEGGGVGYGLGWNVMEAGGGRVRHLGASGTLAWLDLKRQNAGVLLTQVKWGNAKQLIPRLMKEVQEIFPDAAASTATR